ncbi:hypothetical protein RugamoR64_19280 [Duganella rhizosphaerae]|uniref:sensor histidine kinase n=1 Tax=Duganella rhizosphaerae TaxID=2885763 RepID=UPI0030EA7A0B
MRRLLHWPGPRATLTAFALVTAAVIGGQTWLGIAQDRRNTLAAERDNGLLAARLLVEHAGQQMAAGAERLAQVADACATLGDGGAAGDAQVKALIEEILNSSRSAGALQFVNRDGKRWASISDFPAFVFSAEERPFIPLLLLHPDNRRVLIGRPFQRFIDGLWVLPMARNLYDHGGRHLGLASTEIGIDYFRNAYERVASSSRAVVQLVSTSGFVVMRSPFDARAIDRDVSASAFMQGLQRGAAEGAFDATDLLDDGKPRLVSYSRVRGFPLVVALGREQDAVLADWRQRSRDRVVLSAALMALVLALTYFLLLHMTRLRELNVELEARVRQRTLKLEQALETVQAMQTELVRAEKMAALGSLVAGIAHELNTPIGNCVTVASTLQGHAAQIGEELRQERPRRSVLEQTGAALAQGSEILVRNLLRAATLVTSFKQVAVDQAGDARRRFDLSLVVEEVAQMLEPMYLKRHRLHLRLAPGMAMDSYPGALGQVLTNFVSNAVNHGFEGMEHGNMTLRTEPVGDDHVLLEFRDDGRGIAPEHLARVFDPFFTTKLGQGGSGLGMHIVYNLTTGMLGGTVSLESPPGGGVSLRLVLPRAAPAARPAADQ